MDQRHESGKPKHARTEEGGMTTVDDELVGLLNEEAQTHRSTRKISRKTSLTQSSIVAIIHYDVVLKYLFLYQNVCFLLLFVVLTFIFHKIM